MTAWLALAGGLLLVCVVANRVRRHNRKRPWWRDEQVPR